MAKLSKFLDDIRRGGQGIGFGFRQQQRPPGLALVVRTSEASADAVARAESGGADAVVVSSAGRGDLAAGLRGVFGEPRSKPHGLALAADGGELPSSPTAWGEIGVDFVVLGEEQPAALLSSEVEKVARLAMDFDPINVRALEALGADAFLLSTAELKSGTRLSIKDLIRVRLLVGSTGKPVLVGVADAGLVSDLEVLMHAGVEGVLLEGERLGAEDVTSFRQAIDKLGPRRVPKRRPGEDVPIIPRAATPAGETGEEGGEPFQPE